MSGSGLRQYSLASNHNSLKDAYMRNRAILFSSFLLVSSSVFAEQGLLEGVAKQAAKDTAKAVAPKAVEKVEAANQTLENAKSLKEGVENASGPAKEAVKQKINQATTEETKKVVETLKTGKGTAENLKVGVDSAPKSAKALKSKAKAKAAEKVLDQLR
jgi:hypothetical protein